jgi:hypothetical protein
MDNIPDLSSISISENVNQQETSPLPVVSGVSDDTIKKKEFDLRIILQLYYSHFSEKLKILATELTHDALLLKNFDNLSILRAQADSLLGSTAAINQKKRILNACVYGIEKTLCNSGFKVDGLTMTLTQDKDFQDNLMRLALKHLTPDETSAEMTCIYHLISTIININAAHSVADLSSSIEQKISTDSKDLLSPINNNYTDL